MNWKRVMATVTVSALVFSGCASSGAQGQGNVKQMTIGTVQSEIKMGMSAAQVAEALGSPNIVTTDEKRREVWIYDKVSSNRVDTSSSAYGTLIILGGSTRSGSSTSTQKTMTIIIKFDENKMVRDFAYNFTQF
ncbi:conserved exported hypothetical protein [Nitrospina gracilis 3/211]|uniref:Outer membrane protein assembly factor BamE domain-containing protein n=1 Tax=Nitrospina gracilis (strain 3/211) TaxID=1266370 RepID=M1YX40_NITG3|nr:MULTISPECIES: outer membrane protein assembly factor BamE [Nitrospina]MCF8723187.1 outer membrane protein assembly factor BamE (lipoprotein component of BamABCDE complex) [Nitrospina sp. Nb-3]CCQ90232.1 conserved exported hypothetical protein [Nitrospina gracilis 3/211]